MSWWDTGLNILGFVTDVFTLAQKRFAATSNREFFARGITDYQSYVYPHPGAGGLFISTSGTQWIPIYGNVDTQHAIYISSWNWTEHTSNATGTLFGAPLDEDVNGVKYYGNPLQLHGRHELVVENTADKQTDLISAYEMYLSGLDYYNTLVPDKDNLSENVLSNEPKIIVWTSEFLVNPSTPPEYDDVTRSLGVHAILLAPETVLYHTTRATSIFYYPDGYLNSPQGFPSVPLWFTGQTAGAIINGTFMFVGKILLGGQTGKPVEGISQAGTPSDTINEMVVTHLLTMVTPPST